MAKQFNPFHHWLGFDENLSQPNHFQLFRVRPNSDDPIGFRKKIHHGAKAILAKLEQMSDEEIGERRKLHTKLRRHVVKAHSTLLDDKLRAAYLKGLRQKVRQQKGSAKPLAVPPPPQQSTAPHSQAPHQSGKGAEVNQAVSPPVTPGAPVAPVPSQQGSGILPASAPTTGAPAIPMAIPLAKTQAPAAPEFGAQPTADASPNFDNLDSGQIAVKTGRVKRKRSPLIPILLVIMTLFCIAGIGALVNNFGLKALNPGPSAKNGSAVVTPAASNNGSATRIDPVASKDPVAGNNAVPVKPDKPTLIRRHMPNDSKPESGSGSNEEPADLSVEYPEAPTTDSGSSTKESGSGSTTKESGSGSTTKDSGSTTKDPDSPMQLSSSTSLEETETHSPNASDNSESQMHSIRFLFDRAHNEMKRGRLDSATEQFKMIEAISQGGNMQGDKDAVAQQLKCGRAVVKLLDGFYDHVKAAALMYRGGQLEPEPGIIVGFVEGNETGVVMRFGQNVAIPYRSMSPGLAMTLALKKGARIVPDWRLQQAAFRIFHSERNDKSEAKTEELIALSEADGYDAVGLRS